MKWRFLPYKVILRRRSAFPITDTELKVIAKAAIIGLKRIPKTGYRAPPARGIPIEL
jgi:hypothetical protein